jgi:hypothetical protein
MTSGGILPCSTMSWEGKEKQHPISSTTISPYFSINSFYLSFLSGTRKEAGKLREFK